MIGHVSTLMTKPTVHDRTSTNSIPAARKLHTTLPVSCKHVHYLRQRVWGRTGERARSLAPWSASAAVKTVGQPLSFVDGLGWLRNGRVHCLLGVMVMLRVLLPARFSR